MPSDVAAILEEVREGSAGWTCKEALRGSSQGADLWVSSAGQLVIVKHHPSAPLERFELVRRLEPPAVIFEFVAATRDDPP